MERMIDDAGHKKLHATLRAVAAPTLPLITVKEDIGDLFRLPQLLLRTQQTARTATTSGVGATLL